LVSLNFREREIPQTDRMFAAGQDRAPDIPGRVPLRGIN
jgi:hypothetical protein